MPLFLGTVRDYRDHRDQGIYMGSKDGRQRETGGDSERLGKLQRPWRPGARMDSRGTGETMETRVYRELRIDRQWKTGETTETLETRVYGEQGCGRQRGRDHADQVGKYGQQRDQGI